MKLKLSITILVLAILAIIVWRRPPQRKDLPIRQPRGAIQSNNISNSSANVAIQSVTNVPSWTNQTKAQPITQNDRAKLEGNALQIVEKGNKPIDFYGQVIDQYSNPVPDVKIKLEAQQWYMASPTEFDSKPVYFEASTATDGKFQIHGNGTTVNLQTVQKSGYILSPKTVRAFRITGNSFESSTIIKMWKEFPTIEPLINGSHVFGIDSGEVYTLDLIHGKKMAGETTGDLRVSITRPNGIKPRDKYPWSFSIEVVGGGLAEAAADDEFMYLAPESGYESKFQMELHPDDSDWKGEIDKQFFVRSRNGQVYGRIQVTVYAVYNVHSAIEVNYAINPNGSRNLQP